MAPTVAPVAACRIETRLRGLVAAARDHLAEASVGGDNGGVVARFVSDLTSVLDGPWCVRSVPGREVRALRHAPRVFTALESSRVAEAVDGSLLSAAVDAFTAVHWTEFYGLDEWSAGFLDRFANGEGVGPDGPAWNDTVIVGLYLFGPRLHYPRHAHPAEEFYIPLVGDATFEVGLDQPAAERSPGDVVIHPANVSHSIRTGRLPSFGIYGWRGDIGAPSWWRRDMADPDEPVRHPTIDKGGDAER